MIFFQINSFTYFAYKDNHISIYILKQNMKYLVKYSLSGDFLLIFLQNNERDWFTRKNIGSFIQISNKINFANQSILIGYFLL